MAINFGQQINQALGQSLNRVGDSRVRAQQLAQRMQEQQFNQRMKQMVQDLRERQFQLSQEAQTEKIMQQAFERQIARDREDRLGELTDARIDNLNNQDSESGGRSDYLKVTEVQTNNNQIEELNSRLQDINDRISSSSQLIDQTANQEGVTMEEAMSDPSVQQAGQQKLTLENKREQIREQIQELRNRNNELFDDNTSVQQTTQQQPSREDLPQVTTREDFDQLEPGALFIGPDGEVKKKRG